MENNEISTENTISDVAEQPKRKPGRPPKQKPVETRAQQTKNERRRRHDHDFSAAGKRMWVDPALKDDANYETRWINDEPGRLHDKTVLDDWDYVVDPNMSPDMRARNGREDAEIDTESSDIGSRISRRVGKNPDGSAKFAYLMRKPREFFEEDKAKAQKQIDEIDQTLKRGQTPGGDGLPGDKSYTPAGGINIDDDTAR